MSDAADLILPMLREMRMEMRGLFAEMHGGFGGIETRLDRIERSQREIEDIFVARSIIGGAVLDELKRRRVASERKEIMVEGPSA